MKLDLGSQRSGRTVHYPSAAGDAGLRTLAQRAAQGRGCGRAILIWSSPTAARPIYRQQREMRSSLPVETVGRAEYNTSHTAVVRLHRKQNTMAALDRGLQRAPCRGGQGVSVVPSGDELATAQPRAADFRDSRPHEWVADAGDRACWQQQ